jgi:glycosyltransferase involved in cell wall biosynthesis
MSRNVGNGSLAHRADKPTAGRRVIVLLPIAYRGGTLNAAVLLARAIKEGSKRAHQEVDVALAHLDAYEERAFADLGDIPRRVFAWRHIDRQTAERAMRYAGFEGWRATHDSYVVPDDCVDNLQSADLWLIVSDRVEAPILPIRPHVMMIFDFLQRYVPFMAEEHCLAYINAARAANGIFVTTQQAHTDALQYVGLPTRKVVKLPMLAPDYTAEGSQEPAKPESYFLWPTNTAVHKNHDIAVRALAYYYEQFDGELACYVTGYLAETIPAGNFPHLEGVARLIESSAALQKNVRWLGELDRHRYRSTLQLAAFLWHPARIDNGTFSVIEAAGVGVPSLSSDYGPMREIDRQFAINLAWMPADDPRAMAIRLKEMETTHRDRRRTLPEKSELSKACFADHLDAYWTAVRAWL